MCGLINMRVLALAAVALLAVAACARGTASTEPESPSSLVVYSGRSESLVGPIIEQFRDATGVDVAVKYGSTSELAATLLEEGRHTPADVFFAQDPGGLGAVAELLAPLPVDIVSLVPDWAHSPNNRWVGISAAPGSWFTTRRRSRMATYPPRS